MRNLFISLLFVGVTQLTGTVSASEKLPNIVFIMTDNHGAWTLGCYGNRDIKTPHIDRLAKEGIRFTRAVACNAVCSPTRASFLTGMLPCGHGVHCFLRGGRLQVGPDAHSTMDGLRTLPEILRGLGYTCGLVGKWHLGDNLRPQCGFSTWVTMPHGGTTTFYDADVIENGRIRKEPTYLTKFWTDRGCDFIAKNKDRRFFLLLAYNGPYGLGRAMKRPPQNRHAETYKNHPLASFPRHKMHPWLHSTKDLFGKDLSRWRYACEVSAVDDGVGRVMQTLKTHKLDSNTLVIFTADQGLAGGHNGIWGMGDHTRPLSAFDYTLDIPLILRHPGRIPEGKTTDILVSNYDLLPSVLHYVGRKEKIPSKLPGRNFAPVLVGKKIAWDQVVYYEFENVRAIRTDRWKYIERYRQSPNELYDLQKDPNEKMNLVDVKESRGERKRLQQQLHSFFSRYADPRYDIWRDGKSKTHLLAKEIFEGGK